MCPKHAMCIYTIQSHYCTCEPGFVSTSGDPDFTDPTAQCKDDICVNSSTCPDLAACQNIPGGYHCTCKAGFVPSFGEEPFTDPRVKCVDVNAIKCPRPVTLTLSATTPMGISSANA
ncbi:unnamed protein product [Caretta caretta]